MRSYRFTRYLEFRQLFEHFFLSAIVAIISIRLYLHLTGYPQLGGGNFHIAHMLWGGLLLVFALLGSLIYLNNDVKNIWAISGGAGFGTFIDEIGKFVTKDNDYFFEPTFAIIYMIFVLIYLMYRTIWYRQIFTREEYLMNSIEELKDVVTNELDKEEIAKALSYLQKSDPKNPLTKFLKKTFQEITDIPPATPSVYQKARTRLSAYYHFLVRQKFIINLIVFFFVLRSAEYIFRGGDFIWELVSQPLSVTFEKLLILSDVFPFINVTGIIAQGVFTVMGAILIRRSRIRAYRFFRSSLLISILILQVFNFYDSPILALLTTIRDIVLLTIVEYMIEQEKIRIAGKSK